MSEETIVTTTDTIESTPESEVETREPVLEETAQPETSTEAESSEETPVRSVPEADAYVLPEGIPKEIGQFAKDNDMTQKQLDSTLAKFGSLIQGNNEATQAALRVDGEQHVQEWGDKSQYNLSLVRRSLKQLDSEGTLAKALDTSGYGNHPAVLDFLKNVGEVMQEGGYLKSEVNVPQKQRDMAHILYPNDVPKN